MKLLITCRNHSREAQYQIEQNIWRRHLYTLGEKPNIELDNISGDDILNKGQQYVINMGFLRKCHNTCCRFRNPLQK